MRMQQDPLGTLERGSDEIHLLIIAAHPDDEVIGAGSRLALFRRLTIVHVTDGAPENMYDAMRHGFRTREEYAAARRAEFADAMRAAGAAPEAIELGITDQQASCQVAHIAAKLGQILRAKRPSFVLTHPYEGGHPDHDACALAVHLAAGEIPVVEFTSYHRQGEGIRTAAFLPNGGGRVLSVELDAEQQQRKREMLQCFGTQSETLALFGVALERFRLAPAYDFTQPPHDGPLYYEQFDWGMTGQRFRSLAREVLQAC